MASVGERDIGLREIALELDRHLAVLLGGFDVGGRVAVQVPGCPAIVVTSVETVGGLAKGFRPLRAGQLRFDRSEDGLGDVVLGCENVSDVAIVVDRPQLITGPCLMSALPPKADKQEKARL